MRFWDSSAVVPLLVGQPASPQADEWLGEDGGIVLWTLTLVELTSAIQRLVRERLIRERDGRDAETRADELVRASHLVTDVEAVKSQARRLLRLHRLRAADALQLGAALEWAGTKPAGRFLHTLDGRLALAARREGFHVVPEPP